MRMALMAGIAAAALGMAGPRPAAAAQATPKVAFTSEIGGPVAGVGSCPSTETDAWPLLARDPQAPSRLHALYQLGGIGATVLGSSTNGGRTWERRPVQAATACAGGAGDRTASVNPLFAAGGGGTVYYGQSWTGRRDGMFAYGVLAHRLRPGEPAHGAPARAFYGQNAAVAADPADPDRLAMLWTQFNEVPNPLTYTILGSSTTLFATSADGGTTWSVPRVLDAPDPDHVNVNTRLVRTSDGGLVAVFDRMDYRDAPGFGVLGSDLPLTLYAMRSDDGGVTWSRAVKLGVHRLHRVPDPDHRSVGEMQTPAGSAKADVAAGPDGSVVVVWHDGSRTVRGAVGRVAGGVWRWSPLPASLRAEAEYIQPAVALDGDGNLGVFFYDFADDVVDSRDEWSVTPRFALSSDGGMTWSTVALSPPFDLHRTNRCDPVTRACDLTVDFMAIGVYQDVEPLGRGFGAGFTVGPPLATTGYADARFARIIPANHALAAEPS